MKPLIERPLDQFLRRLVIAPVAKQVAAAAAAEQVLTGKPPDRILYCAADAAKLISVSRTAFWRLTKTGQIRPVQIPGFGRPRFRRADLDAIAAGQAGGET
jgi:hypothetical protein